jgi:hypothetical protein
MKKKEFFNLKGDEVILMLLRGSLYLIRNGHSYPLEAHDFSEVSARLKLAEERNEEFPDVLWELRGA